jgi:hypothetical protein
MNEAKLIREELAYIGRYLDGISPKLSKAQELLARKKELQDKLQTIKDKTSGVNPKPMKKELTKFRDIVTPIIGKKNYNVDRIAHNN